MKDEPLEKVLDSLKAIKVSMHDVAETCVNEELDKAISLVEQRLNQGNSGTNTTEDVLVVIGKVLEKLPSVVALLKLFSG